MCVIDGRQSGADVEELPDPLLFRQVTDRPGQEIPALAGEVAKGREDLAELVADELVDRVVVLASEPVIPDPCRVRHGYFDLVGGAQCEAGPIRAGLPDVERAIVHAMLIPAARRCWRPAHPLQRSRRAPSSGGQT